VGFHDKMLAPTSARYHLPLTDSGRLIGKFETSVSDASRRCRYRVQSHGRLFHDFSKVRIGINLSNL
jgi:hypothetical protein